MLVWVKKYWVKIGKKCYNKRSKFPSVLFSNRNLTQCQMDFFKSRAIHAEQETQEASLADLSGARERSPKFTIAAKQIWSSVRKHSFC